MKYKPKSIGALHIALGGLPGHMRIEVEPGIAVSAKTVGELRKITSWPENLVITTPQERHSESVVKNKQGERRHSLPTETVGMAARQRCGLRDLHIQMREHGPHRLGVHLGLELVPLFECRGPLRRRPCADLIGQPFQVREFLPTAIAEDSRN
jgi:hypothetical protein